VLPVDEDIEINYHPRESPLIASFDEHAEQLEKNATIMTTAAKPAAYHIEKLKSLPVVIPHSVNDNPTASFSPKSNLSALIEKKEDVYNPLAPLYAKFVRLSNNFTEWSNRSEPLPTQDGASIL
jgi:hypothetical protein